MSRKRILVIEDDYDVAEMLLTYFETQEYQIYHAENGLAGLEMARTYFPNLVLLDVMLPDIDGYEVCQQLRQTSLTKYIPVIFLSQRDGRADRVRGLELGADDYITKPFDVEELQLRVMSCIRRATRTSLQEARTGLPTGPLVDDERRSRQGKNQAEIRLGIEGFDAYRDVYGFIAADEAFGFAGQCVQEVISQQGTQADFIGVADNEFVIFTHASDPHDIETQIKDYFAENIKAFYSFVDVDQGGVILEPGTAHERLAPLMSFNTVKTTV